MTAKESKAVARWAGLCVRSQVESDTDMVEWKDYAELQSALYAAEAERDAFRKELLLMEHKVITCGVAASHPDKLLTTHGAYKTKWDSPQAHSVRELRDAKDAAEAELGELLRRVGVVAADLLESAGYCGYGSDERAVYAGASEQLRQLLASDGGADGGES